MASTALLLLMAMAIVHGSSTAWCFASDTISASSPISGDRTVVSRGGKFELGFFSPTAGGSNYYVGIWYKMVVSQRTPVWVANRAAPVADPASSRLAVAADGNLVLINEAGKPVWSSNVSSASSSNGAAAVAVILDTGNLELRRKSGGEVLWQSVEHPTDTWLPGVRLGMNKITGQALVSWKNAGDPAPGMFTLGIDPNGSSQYFTKQDRDFLEQRRVEGRCVRRGPGDDIARQVRLRVRERHERQLLLLLPAGPHGDLQASPGRPRPGEADHVGAVRPRVDDHLDGAAPAVRRLRRPRRVRRLQREASPTAAAPPASVPPPRGTEELFSVVKTIENEREKTDKSKPVTRLDRRPKSTSGCGPRLFSAILNSGTLHFLINLIIKKP
ncbi:hypothetical protein C2845_PM09G21920 [Panicum miliaceum]|uniref:non-specific serine/threonine protein kinase n=1 Tax=Panicum miliaceum TaxID=4540 RepID=A0A3L6S3Y0_PANMI|nr:hypothetical protein C2845_PM09G21920 [Panicum miliaceum]